MPIRRKHHNSRFDRKCPIEHTGFHPHLMRYLEWIEVHGYSPETAQRKESSLRRFIAWCDERGLNEPREITKPVLERYQRHLYHYRKPNGQPLAFSSQNIFLSAIRGFFKWLTRENYLLYNPASELVPPKRPKRLPQTLLSRDEMALILNQPDLNTPDGVRDRTILELFYASGIRRMELLKLRVQDVDTKHLVLYVRQGKGAKDRLLPLSEEAGQWLEKYLHDIRPQLVLTASEERLFLSDYGEPYTGGVLGRMIKKRLKQAGIEGQGGCHLFRHACATHMLENGADIRFIQALLGHEDLSSTQIYTHVAIEKLRAVHAATHPRGQGRGRKETGEEECLDTEEDAVSAG
jgi:integrase/recombinase XerD